LGPIYAQRPDIPTFDEAGLRAFMRQSGMGFGRSSHAEGCHRIECRGGGSQGVRTAAEPYELGSEIPQRDQQTPERAAVPLVKFQPR
jgi:hypothetical protein